MLFIKSLIYKYRLLSIMFLAILTVLGLTILSSFPKEAKSVTIIEKNGVYDLVGIDNLEGEVIKFSPSTSYYPNIYLMPEKLDKVVPESIENFDVIRAEYLSQRFVLNLPDNSDTYNMNFNLSGRHAMEVYVNGRFAGQTGKIGTNKGDTEVWENNIAFYGMAVNGKMDIILHSAQFYHAKRGASLAELSLSKSGMTFSSLTFKRIKGMVIIGGFLAASVMLFSIYIMISHTWATLYFSLACIVYGFARIIAKSVVDIFFDIWKYIFSIRIPKFGDVDYFLISVSWPLFDWKIFK